MRWGLVVAAAVVSSQSGALAQTYPLIKGEFQTRIQSDYTVRSKDKSQEISDTFTKTEFGVELGLTEEFSVRSKFKLEPVKAPDGDRFFGDHGLWLDELLVQYENDSFSLFAGKFHPKFSFGYDKAPYIYGRDFVEDYELTEKIGIGGSLKIAPEGWGEHALTGAVYFQDSTPLSNSALSRPRFGDPRTDRPARLRKRDGGVSNTRTLESFALSLDGADMPFAPGLEYTVGYRYQKRGETEGFDEKGFVAGLAYAIELADELTLTPMVEYADFQKFEGADASARYLTGSLLLEYGPWSASTSYTGRRIKVRGDEPSTDDDRLFQVSAGYTFDFGLGLYVGWKNQRVAGVSSDTVGAMAIYGFKF
jgi:hypothetical protein